MDPRLAADLLAVTHFGFVAFVVGGQILILWGGWRGWAWIRNPWFRWGHLAAIGVVVAQVLLGAYCPLTILEARWRAEAGLLESGFIGYWVGRILYYDIPLWQAHIAYLVFGGVTVWSFFRWPPRR